MSYADLAGAYDHAEPPDATPAQLAWEVAYEAATSALTDLALSCPFCGRPDCEHVKAARAALDCIMSAQP